MPKFYQRKNVINYCQMCSRYLIICGQQMWHSCDICFCSNVSLIHLFNLTERTKLRGSQLPLALIGTWKHCSPYTTAHPIALLTLQHCSIFSTAHSLALLHLQHCSPSSTAPSLALLTLQHCSPFSTVDPLILLSVQHCQLTRSTHKENVILKLH